MEFSSAYVTHNYIKKKIAIVVGKGNYYKDYDK